MFASEQQAIETQIRAFCAANSLPEPALLWTPIPFAGQWGLSTSFFQLAAQDARALKERGGQAVNVPLHAQQIAERIAAFLGTPPGFERVEAVKGYVNLYFAPQEYARRVAAAVLADGPAFGRGAPKGEQVMVEFSQPNTHKAFHVGHLRGTILGDVLARIIEFAGYDVVRSNYPGDMGLHVIKWLWCYIKYHNGERPESDITQWMGKVYAEASRRLEETPELEAEVRALYARWDQRDPEVVALWQETRQWSLDGFNDMYTVLGIHFDRYYFNSEEEHPGKAVVGQLLEKGLAMDERPNGGAVIVKLDELLGLSKEKYRVVVVLRSDSTALYATEDLALALHKFRDYPELVRSIYLVDVRQSLHFTQVFKTLELAGYAEASKCLHIPYEIVNLPGNVVMSSREGTVVLLENLIREAISRAREETARRNPELTGPQLDLVSRAIGIGALKYPIVSREGAKIVTFDWESALDFNGQAAPYIQYAHVRCNSIQRKAAAETVEDVPAFQPFAYPLEPAEIQLIDLISRFPAEVQRAAAEYKPLMIATLAYELARAFNDFYDTCPVLKAQPEVRQSRLMLVKAAKQAIANALALLGITAPEVM